MILCMRWDKVIYPRVQIIIHVCHYLISFFIFLVKVLILIYFLKLTLSIDERRNKFWILGYKYRSIVYASSCNNLTNRLTK